MIFYFAGTGRKVEDVEKIVDYPSKNWGVLLSYKDIKTKKGDGSKRFKAITKRKEEFKQNNKQ